MSLVEKIANFDPREAAEELLQTDAVDEAWLDTFLARLDRRRGDLSLARTLALWDLNESEAAQVLGISRKTLSQWCRQGIPSERILAIADLAAASDLLVRYVKRERIPAVVRRGIPVLDGVSLLDLLKQGRTGELLKGCRDMFDFEVAQA